MAQLILPKQYAKATVGKSKLIRTVLNAPLSAMKKIIVPERCREDYYKLANNKDWCNKNMIGVVEFVDDTAYAKIQRKRAAIILHEQGRNTEGVVE